MPLLKCSAGKAKPQSAIGYITNPNKAEIISVRNLFEDEDYAKQFEQTAALYGKGKGYNERKYYHFKLSCARQDNLTPQEAHKFAEEVAEKLFRDYECVLATHTDTDTVHSHIIVNAVDPLTGKKLQFSPKDYIAMKDEVNRLGKEHDYMQTDFRKCGKNSRTAAERKIMLNGGVSWKEELREVIVEAIGKSHNEQEFKDYLKACYGVEITRSGKDYSYLHPQKQKPIRGAKLGINYTKSEVLRKLGEQNNGHKTTTDNGRGRGYIREQPSGTRIVRTGKGAYGRSAGSLIAASPKYIPNSDNIVDDTIFCDMQTGEVKSGVLHYSDEFIAECAQSLAYYLLDNSDIVKQMETDYGNNCKKNGNLCSV